MSTGTQVSPDMLQDNAFPDWGPHVKDISQEPRRLAAGAAARDAAHDETSWQVDDKTIAELYLIWHMTGVMDMIKASRRKPCS
jgi:heterodisulfide reductase subunit C